MNYIFLLNMSFFILSCVVIKNLYCTAKIRIFVISSLQKRVFFLIKYVKKTCSIIEGIKNVAFSTAFYPII